MTTINERDVVVLFDQLNNKAPDYILIRNINQELPSNLLMAKDIDLLIRNSDHRKFEEFLFSLGFHEVQHPLRNDVYLYGVDRFHQYLNKESGILLDLNFQLAVRSLDAGQWIPLDQEIQKSAWENKRFYKQSGGFSFWFLSPEDEFICLVSRSVFDKRHFDEGYQKRIETLLPQIEIDIVMKKFDLIFFKFSSTLLKNLEQKKYETILANYIEFKDY